MKDRSFSEEELRQREKEERSRRRKQEQAYREAQRGVYSRIYEEQDAMPEDYRQALWEDERDDDLYDDDYGTDREIRYDAYYHDPRYEDDDPTRGPDEDWADERRRIQQELGGEDWRDETVRRPRADPAPPEDEDDEWQPLVASQRTAPLPDPRTYRDYDAYDADDDRDAYDEEDDEETPPPPPRKKRPAAQQFEQRPRPKKRRKRRRVLLIVLLVLLALVAAGLIVHQIYVRPPDLPAADNTASQENGTDPGSLGVGRKEDVYTFLLVGRDDGGGGNTDTMMVGCYDVKNGTVDILSIYRDTMVDVPWEIPKINSVYNQRGIEGVQEQVKNLIGYRPDYYFVVELDAVSELVDAIGGVDYDVPYNMDYDDPTQDLHIHYKQGMQHLSGSDAVRVLRWRKNNSGEKLSVGDVGRVTVQHSFLKALAGQLVSLGNLTKIGEIARIVDDNLDSNLTYGEMIWFGERALGLDQDAFRFHNLPGDYTGTMWSQTYRNYQSYVFVNGTALRELVNQYMNPYLTDITADMQHITHDTTVNNLPVESDTAGEESSGDGQSGGTSN